MLAGVLLIIKKWPLLSSIGMEAVGGRVRTQYGTAIPQNTSITLSKPNDIEQRYNYFTRRYVI